MTPPKTPYIKPSNRDLQQMQERDANLEAEEAKELLIAKKQRLFENAFTYSLKKAHDKSFVA